MVFVKYSIAKIETLSEGDNMPAWVTNEKTAEQELAALEAELKNAERLSGILSDKIQDSAE